MADKRKGRKRIEVSQLPRGPYCFAERHTFLVHWRNKTLRNTAASPLERAAALEVSVLVALDEGDVAEAMIVASEAYAILDRAWRAA
jgi:hypothetical protein